MLLEISILVELLEFYKYFKKNSMFMSVFVAYVSGLVSLENTDDKLSVQCG